MEKKVKLDSKNSILLNNNVGWLFIYKDQFGRDIVPSLVPVLNAGIDLVFGIYKELGGNITKERLMQVDPAALTDAIYAMAGIESVDLIHIVWALAKNADEEIPEPREWVKQFDVFPIDIIAPEVYNLVFKSMVSTKNLKRLQNLKESLQPALTSIAS